VVGSFSGGTNLFLRDLQFGTNRAMTTGGVSAETMTPSGRYIAFAGAAPGVATRYVYVWDTVLAKMVFTNFTTGVSNLALSANGNLLAFATASELRAADRGAQTSWLVASFSNTSRPAPRVSADGNWLAYDRRSGLWQQTYLYDVRNHGETLVSHGLNSAAEGGGDSDAPDISPDGRFVAYRTLATNVITGANGYMRQVVLYDRQSGLNQLVSASRLTGLPGDDHSSRPRFSTDGQTLLIQSWASDLAGNDFNRGGDVIAHAIFTAVILPPAPGQGAWLYWPYVPGNNYGVQFKNHLDDPLWQNLTGTFTNIGVKAWQQDTTPATTQRFYRIFSN
jgi:Tol biopolymer transport system component